MTAETFTSYDGEQLAFTRLGSGPPLVCQPGGPGRAAAYLEDLGGLAETRTLIRLDVRGTGSSPVPSDPQSYRYDRLAEDIEALRAHLGIDQLDLLGHSAGGLVAQAYAALHGEHLRRLVLVGTAIRSGAVEKEERQAAVRGRLADPLFAEAAEAMLALPDAPAYEARRLNELARPLYYGRWEQRQQDHAATADTQISKRAAAFFAPRGDAEAAKRAAMVERLASLAAPVLCVVGAQDVITPPAWSYRLAAAVPDGSVVELEGAGHFPWTDSYTFAVPVEAFLAQPDRV